MHHAKVTVIADSISPGGIRISSLQLQYWRPIHSELMTHRKLSKSAGSSRARPSQAIIDQVCSDPWGPLHWGKNQAGMQAEEELTDTEGAKAIWRLSAAAAGERAQQLMKYGAHKQIVNRLLEPFTYIDVLITGTEFNNWFTLRDHPDAQPEIQDLARRMRVAMDESTPRVLEPGEWHLPYIQDADWDLVAKYLEECGHPFCDRPAQLHVLKRVSAARCARISYKAFDGSTSIAKDLELFEKLLGSQPLHASPAEHQATPDWIHLDQTWGNPNEHGNFTGWRQFRKQLPGEFVPG